MFTFVGEVTTHTQGRLGTRWDAFYQRGVKCRDGGNLPGGSKIHSCRKMMFTMWDVKGPWDAFYWGEHILLL